MAFGEIIWVEIKIGNESLSSASLVAGCNGAADVVRICK